MLKVILNRLKPQTEEIVAEEQVEFRTGRRTTEQIFNLRILWVPSKPAESLPYLHRFQRNI